MSHRILFVLFVLVKPIQVAAKSDIWDLEMEFQYSERTKENSHEDSLIIKLCNPTDQIITFGDDIHYGWPFYTVSYEIKGNELVSTIQNSSFKKSDNLEIALIDAGKQKQMTYLKGGECKIYSEISYSIFGAYYDLKVREMRGRKVYENHRNKVNSYLDQDDLDALLPKTFRVRVSIMDGSYDAPKTKGVTFHSDWFSITDYWFTPTFENKPIIQE